MEFKNENVKKVYDITQTYFIEKKQLEDELKRVATEYKGQRLTAETENINTALNNLRTATMGTVSNICREMQSKINAKQEENSKASAALDVNSLSSDYEFLKLPVKLTESEINTLHCRNIDDALFNRALTQYVENNGIVMHSPLVNPVTEQRNAIARLENNFSKFITSNDETTLSVFTKCGSLEELDDKLSEL